MDDVVDPELMLVWMVSTGGLTSYREGHITSCHWMLKFPSTYQHFHHHYQQCLLHLTSLLLRRVPSLSLLFLLAELMAVGVWVPDASFNKLLVLKDEALLLRGHSMRAATLNAVDRGLSTHLPRTSSPGPEIRIMKTAGPSFIGWISSGPARPYLTVISIFWGCLLINRSC